MYKYSTLTYARTHARNQDGPFRSTQVSWEKEGDRFLKKEEVFAPGDARYAEEYKVYSRIVANKEKREREVLYYYFRIHYNAIILY